MARISDVMASSRDSSPDPITLPSSPLGSRSPRKTRMAQPSSSPRKVFVARAARTSPSKSMVLDTPKAGDGSPWRIRVTVEAEPREGSPGKRISRTTTVPLHDPDAKTSSSPAKSTFAAKLDGAEIKRPARKRKGTPIREKRLPRPPPEAEVSTGEDIAIPPQPSLDTPSRRISRRLARLSAPSNSTRSKRLSFARVELDQALQDAIGRSDPMPNYDVPGDKTVSMNEDFSIVSLDSLQSAKEASLLNTMQTIPEGDSLTAGVLHAQNAPPIVHYPQITGKAARAKVNLPNEYDQMSWKPTGPANQRHDSRRLSNQSRWQQERETTSQQIESAHAEDVLVVDDDGNEDPNSDLEDEENEFNNVDEDIWQDEASRSINNSDEDANPPITRRDLIDEPIRSSPLRHDHAVAKQHQNQRDPAYGARHSPQLEDLFAGQPVRPLRSKIPRTWRRSSGMDFSYVDSPAHEVARETSVHEERRQSTDGSRVLTPPTTDTDSEESEDADDGESDFQPEAEATQFHGHSEYDPQAPSLAARNAFVAPEDDSSGSESLDDDDTGNFFSNNIPQVYNNRNPRKRPPRQKTMDLTELLNLDAADSPKKVDIANPMAGSGGQARGVNSSSQRISSSLRMSSVNNSTKNSPPEASGSKTLSSPLRRSLLKSSKVRSSPLAGEAREDHHIRPLQQAPRHSRLGASSSALREDIHSKFSDPRSLDNKIRVPERKSYDQVYAHHHNRSYGDDGTCEDRIDRSEQDVQYENEDEDSDEHMPSYEENLNKDSPQKVSVDFNDSRTGPSLLAPGKNPSLFDEPRYVNNQRAPAARLHSPGTITLVDKKPVPEPGIFSRLSSTFWAAIVRPTGPTEILPKPEPPVFFSPELRTQLRRRYGVVSEEIPWTMLQMQVLHRMLNSQLSNRADSLIPRSGPLPSSLTKLLNTTQTSDTGYKWLFTPAHAYTVLAFFQVLVPASTIAAMVRGEIEWLGDALAVECRGFRGRSHGSEPMFKDELYGREIAEWADGMKGKIGVEFVVRCLGYAVQANDELVKREGLSFEELQRLDRVAKMGGQGRLFGMPG